MRTLTFTKQRRAMLPRSVGTGFLETADSTMSPVIGCAMKEPAWLDDAERDVVEGALGLSGPDQTLP